MIASKNKIDPRAQKSGRMRSRPPRTIPQPRPLPLVGNVPDVGMTTPIQSMMRLARELGPLYRLDFPGQTLLVASSQEIVAELCDEARFDKHVHGALRHIRKFAGDGLFTANTDEPNWERAHRILMPAFGPAAMRDYFDPMLDVAEQMLEKWERLGPRAELDVPDNMTRLTLDTIALSGFGYRFNSFYQREMHPFVDAMVRGLAEAGARSRRQRLQTRLMLATQRQFARDVAFMKRVVDEVIAERRAAGEAGRQRDLLGLMLAGEDPVTHERLDDVNIRNQIVTFLIAGHETTSGLLSFTIYQLLKCPEVLARAHAEVDRVLGSAGTPPTFEKLHRLTYLDQILRESLRLWPTAPAFAVEPRQDTVIAGDFAAGKGQPILVLTPMLHRDPKVWPDPERFDPGRFSVEAVKSRPDSAWKPFGNGQRACIGRQFAMQEATLVLAMILQRFELVDHTDYQLRIKETLTLKPEGFAIRVRPRVPSPPSVVTPPQAAVADAAAPPKAEPRASHGAPVLVLFGSNMGSSERFAQRIASDATRRGYAATVAPMDAYASRLPTSGLVLIVTASYNGQPPDNARAFCQWLETLAPGALAGVRYGVFGCGHRDWAATFQAVPQAVDTLMHAAGAERLLARGAADAGGDFFGDFDSWYEPVWAGIDAAFAVESGAAGADAPPLYEVERGATASDALDVGHGAMLMEVAGNRELVDRSSPLARSKRHLDIALPEGVSYRVGDYFAVLPENDLALVTRVVRRFALELDEPLVVRRTRDEKSALPLDRPLSARELFCRHVELQAPATRRDIRVLAQHTRCPPEKQALLALSDESPAGKERYRAEVLDKRVSILDLLERFAACELPVALFLELVPAAQPRLYSISSSPLADPRRCTLTVAVVEGDKWSGGGRYRGTCSNYLARVAAGERLRAMIRPARSAFRPPDNPKVPIVMVAAGTGIAPFRGFIEERAALAARGEALGEAVLFFGCDHPEVDFLYAAELTAWRAVVEVLPAFSRNEQLGVTFVQHRLWAERDRVAALLGAGAHVYVCGDGKAMAPAVRETVARIRQHQSGGVLADAIAWLDQIEREGRYVADVF
ncbi:MAG: bifunctional reductase 1 [bacterium]|nr:bifunctional reductase 1 [bacterium]